MKILSTRRLKKYFPIRSGVFLQISGWVRALENVNMEISQGETIGIVGESGCGKSTLGRTIVKIYEPTAGSITYCDPGGESRDISGKIDRRFDSLDPRMTIRDTNMALIFISHNLDVVHHMSDRIMVMYLGNVVETALATELFDNPAHPYTQALMSAIPSWNPKDRKLGQVKLEGEPPSPINPPSGCPFHPRCPHRLANCSKARPDAAEVSEGHFSACHLHGV